MYGVRIIVYDTDDITRKAIRTHLDGMAGAEVIGEATDANTAHRLVRHQPPDIVLIEVEGLDDPGMNLAAKIHEEFVDVQILVTSQHKNPDLILKAMQSGAREFLVRPLEFHLLAKAVEKIAEERSRALSGAGGKGRSLTFFSNKGGVGATSLATNVAAGLARELGCEVALADFDLQLGNIASYLDLSPTYTISDLVHKLHEVSPRTVNGFLTKHSSGVHVLAEPRTPAEAESISPEQVASVLQLLRGHYPVVVNDTPHVFDERTLEILDNSDEIYVITELSLPALRNLKKCFDVFRGLQYGRQSIRVIVNRHDPKSPITLQEVVERFDFEPFWVVPNDFPRMINGINTGVPVVLEDKGGEIGKSLRELCRRLATPETEGEEEESDEKQRAGFLKGIFRKR
jgi:pilus assembly protein CpaE